MVELNGENIHEKKKNIAGKEQEDFEKVKMV